MLRYSSKIVHFMKRDVFLIQRNSKSIKCYSTLTKIPVTILNRKRINFNKKSSSITKFLDKLTDTLANETEVEAVTRFTKLFDDCNIDGWWVRKHMADLSGMDMIPHPLIIQAALRACRRLNDYALGVRFMEMVKFKCGGDDDAYKWLNDQVKVVFAEVGMNSPEELCYDTPEMFLDSVTTPFLSGDQHYGPIKPKKFVVPISQKPPPVCKPKGSIDDIDLKRKPPPPCMTPTTPPGTLRPPPIPLKGAQKTHSPKPDDCDKKEDKGEKKAKPDVKATTDKHPKEKEPEVKTKADKRSEKTKPEVKATADKPAECVDKAKEEKKDSCESADKTKK